MKEIRIFNESIDRLAKITGQVEVCDAAKALFKACMESGVVDRRDYRNGRNYAARNRMCGFTADDDWRRDRKKIDDIECTLNPSQRHFYRLYLATANECGYTIDKMLLINKIKRYNLDEQLNDNGVRNLIYLTNPEDEASPFHYYTTDFDDAVMLMDKLPTLKTEPIWDTFDMDPRELRDILDQIDNLIGSRDGWYRNVDISNVDIGDEYRSNGYYEDEYLDASYED